MGHPVCTGQRLAAIHRRRAGYFGFTVIEILIVLALLGIVAITVVPQFSRAAEDAQLQTVQGDLDVFRRQIDRYRAEHGGRLPAYETDSEADFVAQLTQRTTESGTIDPTGRCGPYLIGDMPPNVFTGRRSIRVVRGTLQPPHFNGSGDHGWVYSSTTGEFRISTSSDVTDREGRPVNSL